MELYMKEFFTVYAFIIGISVGSFLNVLIYRLPLGLNVAKGRSFCPNCKHSLGVLDLFPLLSFLLLGRKCRYCKAPISWQYFSIELLCGLLYALTVYRFYPSPKLFLNLWIISLLLVIVMIDYKEAYVEPILNLLIAVSSVLYIVLFEPSGILRSLASCILFASPFILASLFAQFFGRSGFGMGDLKLALSLGITLPIESMLVIMGVLLGVIVVKLALFIILKNKIYIFSEKKFKKGFAFADVIAGTYILSIVVPWNHLLGV